MTTPVKNAPAAYVFPTEFGNDPHYICTDCYCRMASEQTDDLVPVKPRIDGRHHVCSNDCLLDADGNTIRVPVEVPPWADASC